VFFTDEDGLRLRMRVDSLRRRCLVDLKSFTARDRHPDVAIRWSIAQFRHDLQAALYLQGYAHLVKFAREGRVFGDTARLPRSFAQQLAAPEDMRFTWIFHAVDVPVSRGLEVLPGSPLLTRATREIALAKRTYRECLAHFGDAMWVDEEPLRELRDADLAPWLREECDVV